MLATMVWALKSNEGRCNRLHYKSPCGNCFYPESYAKIVVTTTQFIADHAYPARATDQLYGGIPGKMAQHHPSTPTKPRQGGEPCAYGRRAYSRMLQRGVCQPSSSHKPRRRATNTSARVNRRTCARCSPPRPAGLRVGIGWQSERRFG